MKNREVEIIADEKLAEYLKDKITVRPPYAVTEEDQDVVNRFKELEAARKRAQKESWDFPVKRR